MPMIMPKHSRLHILQLDPHLRTFQGSLLHLYMLLHSGLRLPALFTAREYIHRDESRLHRFAASILLHQECASALLLHISITMAVLQTTFVTLFFTSHILNKTANGIGF